MRAAGSASPEAALWLLSYLLAQIGGLQRDTVRVGGEQCTYRLG